MIYLFYIENPLSIFWEVDIGQIFFLALAHVQWC